MTKKDIRQLRKLILVVGHVPTIHHKKRHNMEKRKQSFWKAVFDNKPLERRYDAKCKTCRGIVAWMEMKRILGVK